MPPTDPSNKKRIRRRYFVEPRLQAALIQQSIWYWAWTSVTFGLVILFCRIAPALLSGNDDPTGNIWYHLGPYLLASILLIPIILWRSIRFSHRFAGPMVRVRRSLKELAQGKSIPELHFRERDFWQDIAGDINDLSVTIDRMRGLAPSDSHQVNSSDADCDPISVPTEMNFSEHSSIGNSSPGSLMNQQS